MASVLLPTRSVQQSQSSEHSEKPCAITVQLQWQGMNPLAWIELIAAEAEKAESLANGKIAAPIRINGSNLSLKRAVHPKLGKNDEHATQLQWPTTLPKAETFELKNEATRKRVRVSAEDHGANNGDWDFKALLNDPSQPMLLIQSLQCLALEFESTGTMSRFVHNSYVRIRDHFCAEFGRITAPAGRHTKSAALLFTLYNDTKLKMEALVQMARSEATPSSKNSEVSSSSLEASACTFEKKDFFVDFMTTWLRENWTNPYPDDDGLLEMAATLNSTPAVVGNWLINARTRKWRPSLVKAFEMERPPELLLEDSLNLFDGKPLRFPEQSED
jgi:Homeobox KN domain